MGLTALKGRKTCIMATTINVRIEQRGVKFFVDYEVEKNSWKNFADRDSYDAALEVKKDLILNGVDREIQLHQGK